MDIRALLGKINDIQEGSMEAAKKHPTGPKFVGKAGPHDSAAQAKRKLVGCSVIHDLDKTSKERTLEWKLQEEYKKFVAEYGMTTGGMVSPSANPSTNAAQATQAAADTTAIKTNLQNLKTKVPNINVAKATDAMTKADTDQPLSNTDKDASAELAPAVADVVKDPQLAGQLKQLIDKGQQKDTAEKLKMQQQGQQGQQGTV